MSVLLKVVACGEAGANKQRSALQAINQSIEQSLNVSNVLGSNWEPTDNRFNSVNLCSRNLYARSRVQPESGHMAGTIFLLVYNIKLNPILRLPLHVLEEALVDEHLEGAQHTGRKNQNEVMLCGCKTAATTMTGQQPDACTACRS